VKQLLLCFTFFQPYCSVAPGSTIVGNGPIMLVALFCESQTPHLRLKREGRSSRARLRLSHRKEEYEEENRKMMKIILFP
jgi:hypothetical protein